MDDETVRRGKIAAFLLVIILAASGLYLALRGKAEKRGKRRKGPTKGKKQTKRKTRDSGGSLSKKGSSYGRVAPMDDSEDEIIGL